MGSSRILNCQRRPIYIRCVFRTVGLPKFHMAAPRFAFEELTAPINWPRVASTNVRQLQKLGDASALRAFLADVCVGDADDGFLAYGGDDRGLGRKALRMNQYATQYLLYSQQILAAQKATLEQEVRRFRAFSRGLDAFRLFRRRSFQHLRSTKLLG